MYHLSPGICANGYPFSHIPTNKSYSPHHRTLQYCKVHWCDHVSFISRYIYECALKNKTQNLIRLICRDSLANLKTVTKM